MQDRWGWIRGHLFGLAIVVATFPALTQIPRGEKHATPVHNAVDLVDG